MFLFVFFELNSDTLNISIDDNRFLDDSNNTIFEINYLVPYNELKFEKDELGFTANLVVEIFLEKNGKIVDQDTFTNRIIVTSFDKTVSDDVFLDKIILTLSQSDYLIKIYFKDETSTKIKVWQKKAELLPRESLISDLEISKFVGKDSTVYFEKFHRGDTLFFVNPNHIFTLPKENIVSIYYKLQNFTSNEKGEFSIEEKLTIKKKRKTNEKTKSDLITSNFENYRLKEIDISKYDSGVYDISINVKDKNSNKSWSTDDYFSVKKNVDLSHRIFPDLDDEYKLVQYFLKSKEKKQLKNLSDNGKKTFLERFWTSNDPNPVTKENEFLEMVRERIQYCNQHFSHFKKGWKTDIGRIYIKKGPPDEIRKLKTSIDTSINPADIGTVTYTKYTIKDYQIWKYRMKQDLTYIFIDLQTSGNYKLIYSGNDENEITLSNWKDYLGGDDFDESLLE